MLTGRTVIAEGKTKIVYTIEGEGGFAEFYAKDDITAGDGKKHDVIEGKGMLANRTTCNVFRLLNESGISTAFVEQLSPNSFKGLSCTMLLWEVVVRREAHGSYLKRNPHLQKGHLFPKLLVEFYLKTSGKVWKGHPLVADDPYAVVLDDKVELYDPAKPLSMQKPFLVLEGEEAYTTPKEKLRFEAMAAIARRTFLVLEKAWQLQNRTLVDMKVEFGIDAAGGLRLADVIDNDSWRLLENGLYIDKQVYRDGGALSDVTEKYRRVTDMTDRFGLPLQGILFWTGSPSDSLAPFDKALEEVLVSYKPGDKRFVCSIHKEPTRGARMFQQFVQDVPDSVVIAYIGRSNGAGPVLSSQSTVPVITVPASIKDFPEDAWSSLRTPSDTPVMTVLEPKNAVLAALNILSARNPALYAVLRGNIEKRLENLVPV